MGKYMNMATISHYKRTEGRVRDDAEGNRISLFIESTIIPLVSYVPYSTIFENKSSMVYKCKFSQSMDAYSF